ncbi:carbohydrate-binding protein [Cellvibrio sp. UBA7671]|uniref:carbohydrate-binding protein n=1 Tax=Cellvibrio sp. UBA7671 TaxID=1946312 RepID=UPI002F35341B
MFKKKELTRLGDILVSKGLITPAQLDLAIKEQSRRKRLLDPADTTAVVTPIGEILIELGFIDQLQLKRGLNWQQRLRHASIAMALCAPFMIFAPSAAANVVRTAPTTIEAENYTAMQGVIAENTTDIGAGKNIGGISTGDWMSYSVDLPAAGTYKITYRVASPNTTGSLILRSANDADLATLKVPKTGGWQVWTSVDQMVTLPKGVQTLKIFAKTGGFNLNWFQLEKITSINAAIEAENYSAMSGVITEATTDIGGGQNVGGISTGDWMNYAGVDIPADGTYKITYRVASPYSTAKITLKSGADVEIGTVSVPKTGGFQVWSDVVQTVTLQKGVQDLKVFAKAGGFNINSFKIEADTAAGITPPVVIATAPAPIAAAATPTAAVLPGAPLTLQAESYSSMSGIISETTTDVGGGKSVGGIGTNDWLLYDGINIPITGEYKITYRVASPYTTAKMMLKSGTNVDLGLLAIPKTGGWQIWTDISHTLTLQQGVQSLKVFAQTGGFNFNWLKIESLVPVSQTIEAESYSSMFGVFNQTTTDVGGGQNVAGIATGEWMTYSGINVPADGNYKITYRVASTVSTGKIALHSAANVELGRVSVPSTGGFQIWKEVEHTVALKKGVQDLKIVAATGGFNLNWFKMEFAGAANASSAASSSAPAVSSSSSSSSAPAVSSSSSSTSSTPAMSSSSWSSSSVAAHVAGPVAITWMAPDKRENGAQLYIDELGGYEIRYKKTADTKYTYVSINDPWTQSYKFDWLEGDYIFQIAAFDKNGVYSPFVDIQRQ